jgi:hypothetical protein
MARASFHTARPFRLLGLALGLALAAALLVPGVLGQNREKKDEGKKAEAKKEAAKKDEPKKAEPRPALAPGLEPRVADTIQMINKKLEAAWEENKLTPAKACDDFEFIRRASLDIIGRIAKPEEIERYFADPAPIRRSQLIERLLKSSDYPINWANLWSNWLLTRSGAFSRGMYHEKMVVWLEDQFASNTRYNDLVKKLITAKGKNTETEGAPANFILAHLGEENPAMKHGEEGHFSMVPITSRITRLFLGVQTQCTQCHDHPFDNNLTQQQFWGINAYLRQVKQDPPPARRNNNRNSNVPLTLEDDPNVNTEAVVYYEKVKNSLVKQTKATFLDGTRISIDPATKLPVSGLARRQELALRIVDHPNFPRAIVNRMWAHFFGKGFTQPFDDFNEQNQVSIPDLLDELATQYKHYGYDQKMLIRWICNSRAYSLSCVANKTNDKEDAEKFFSRMLLKVQTPEQLFESLMCATDPGYKSEKDPEKNKSAGEAVKKLRDQWQSRLVANFGDDEGNEVSFNGTVVQALMMMNGKEINDAITRKEHSTLAESIQRRRGAGDAIIKDLYMAALNRPPTVAEITKIRSAFPLYLGVRDKDAWGPYQDLFWAILNSNEFMLNH